MIPCESGKGVEVPVLDLFFFERRMTIYQRSIVWEYVQRKTWFNKNL